LVLVRGGHLFSEGDDDALARRRMIEAEIMRKLK